MPRRRSMTEWLRPRETREQQRQAILPRGASPPGRGAPVVIGADEALDRLRAGNRRFVADLAHPEEAHAHHVRLTKVASGQEPFAIVLGCSDSRVPAELVFGQGVGDLFVIRVAGNVVAPSQIGSIEYAATAFGTRLVVVLGHTLCGAILTTIRVLRQPPEHRSRNLASIVDRVRPAVEGLLSRHAGGDDAELVEAAVRANIRNSVRDLRRGSEVITDLMNRDGLVIVGAEYSLETGVVEFIDGP